MTTFYAHRAQSPCCVPGCGSHPVHLHHVAHADLPRRGHDLEGLTVIPLCHVHHTDGGWAVHVMGERRFLEAHGLDLSQALRSGYASYAASVGLSIPAGLDAREQARWLLEHHPSAVVTSTRQPGRGWQKTSRNVKTSSRWPTRKMRP